MGEYTKQDVAEKAGVDADHIDRLAELGVLAPDDDRFSSGDVRRVRLIQTLERAGVPLEGIAAAIRDGKLSLAFMDLASYDRFASLTAVTFRELTAKTGIPFELLATIREAIGFAEPEPEDFVREDEMAIVPLVEIQVRAGFRHSVIDRWLRVCGDSLRRVAETEGDWWHTEIEVPLLESGMGMAEVMEVSDRGIGQEIAPHTDRMMLAIYHGQEEHAWTKNIIDGVEAALAEAGVYSRLERPPAICFLDITGYTRLTEEHGDEAAADLAGRLARLVRRTSARYGGKAVKFLGDGVMFYFRDPGPAVLAALEMVEGVQQEGLPPAHVGLHSGPVLFQEGDYFGRTVNVAARIADYARQGEVVVSAEVVASAGDPGVAFTEIGLVELKGVSGPTRLSVARRNGRPADPGLPQDQDGRE